MRRPPIHPLTLLVRVVVAQGPREVPHGDAGAPAARGGVPKHAPVDGGPRRRDLLAAVVCGVMVVGLGGWVVDGPPGRGGCGGCGGTCGWRPSQQRQTAGARTSCRSSWRAAPTPTPWTVPPGLQGPPSWAAVLPWPTSLLRWRGRLRGGGSRQPVKGAGGWSQGLAGPVHAMRDAVRIDAGPDMPRTISIDRSVAHPPSTSHATAAGSASSSAPGCAAAAVERSVLGVPVERGGKGGQREGLMGSRRCGPRCRSAPSVPMRPPSACAGPHPPACSLRANAMTRPARPAKARLRARLARQRQAPKRPDRRANVGIVGWPRQPARRRRPGAWAWAGVCAAGGCFCWAPT